MSNKTVTNLDLNRGNGFHDPVYQDDTFTSAGADELLKGTILARSTATGKLILYVKGGSTDGNGVPKAVLPYALSISGAGDTPVRPLIQGRCAKSRLVIDADGDDSNIDAAVIDLLRDFGITVLKNTEESELEA